MTRTMTTEEARAIRGADALCFDHDSDGNGQIRAVTRGKDWGHEHTVTIPVEFSRVNNYGPTDGPWTCFAYIGSAQYDDRARTLVRRMRAGTAVAFVWTRDNSSPVTNEAGIVVDMLDVKVGNGSTVDTYRVETFVGLDNSARMVRQAPRLRHMYDYVNNDGSAPLCGRPLTEGAPVRQVITNANCSACHDAFSAAKV